MSRAEKLMAMEALWEDLTRDEKTFESPAWHLEELAATEERMRSGKERPVDWEIAKEQLRRRRK
ncbi:MAG: addiction module protein [Verrucomicrobiota bacterium]